MPDGESVLRLPVTAEQILNEAAAGDAVGPLPCGCYRLAVIDFGHDCGVLPREHPRLQRFDR